MKNTQLKKSGADSVKCRFCGIASRNRQLSEMIMSNVKCSTRGFTLIELMVVIAIIGVLATIISAPIQTYLKKSRDAKRIADISQLKDALGQYAVDHNGYYPSLLENLAPDYLKTLPTNATSTAEAKDKYMYVVYRDTATPKNNISYHLGTALEFQNTAIQNGLDADCTTTTCASGYGDIVFTNYATSKYVTATAAADPTAAGDFNGLDVGSTPTTACTPVVAGPPLTSNCIYDVTP